MAAKKSDDYDVLYKSLIIGESGVGKTAMLRTLMGEGFAPSMLPTIGIDFIKKIIDVDGAKVLLEVWDTAGQERFRTITKLQYRGTKGILLVYDMTSIISFKQLKFWLDNIGKELDNGQQPPIIFIIGNKSDLEDSRVVTSEMGFKLKERYYEYAFEETSAKNNTNIGETFEKLARAMIESFHPKLIADIRRGRHKRTNLIEDLDRRGSIKLTSTVVEDSNSSKSNCC